MLKSLKDALRGPDPLSIPSSTMTEDMAQKMIEYEQQVMAEKQAARERSMFITQQMTNFRNNIRVLHVSLLLAASNGELSGEFKTEMRSQLLQIATILEGEI